MFPMKRSYRKQSGLLCLKASDPTSYVLSENVTFCNFAQSMKTWLETTKTLAGKANSTIDSHPLNVPQPIVVTVDGNVVKTKFLSVEKAKSPTETNPSSMIVFGSKFWQL